MDKINVVKQWLLNTGNLIQKRLNEQIEVSIKSSYTDLVTNVDQEVEQLFKTLIQTHFPDDAILGEESAATFNGDLNGNIWIIDPIDGTLNFVKEQRHFAIMVAYYEKKIGQFAFIYDVMAQELFFAKKGEGAFLNDVALARVADDVIEQSLISVSSNLFFQHTIEATEVLKQSIGLRMVGSTAHSMIALLTGRYSGYLTIRVHPWDYMAGLIFADELGLVYSTVENEIIPLFEKTTLVIATPTVHRTLINGIHIKK